MQTQRLKQWSQDGILNLRRVYYHYIHRLNLWHTYTGLREVNNRVRFEMFINLKVESLMNSCYHLTETHTASTAVEQTSNVTYGEDQRKQF